MHQWGMDSRKGMRGVSRGRLEEKDEKKVGKSYKIRERMQTQIELLEKHLPQLLKT